MNARDISEDITKDIEITEVQRAILRLESAIDSLRISGRAAAYALKLAEEVLVQLRGLEER